MSGSDSYSRAVRGLGIAAALGMLLVLVMGATVTTTGSAQGCGRDWPLCNGRFVPEFAVGAAVEFSHRAVTAVEGLLVLTLAASVLGRWRRMRVVKVLVALMIGSLLLQAGMGAWAVKYPQQPVVLALHFGISLIALAAVTLVALFTRDPGVRIGMPVAAPSVRWAAWSMTGYLYLLVYSGAFIRHAGAAYGCAGWPLCGPSPGAAAGAVNVVHRVAAAGALVLAMGLLYGYQRVRPPPPDLVRGATVLAGALALQAGAGAFLVLSRWSLFAELLHAALSGIAFTAAAFLCYRVSLGTAKPGSRPAGLAAAPLSRRSG